MSESQRGSFFKTKALALEGLLGINHCVGVVMALES